MRQRAIEIFLIIVTLLKYFRIWITKRIEPAKRHKYCLVDERPQEKICFQEWIQPDRD